MKGVDNVLELLSGTKEKVALVNGSNIDSASWIHLIDARATCCNSLLRTNQIHNFPAVIINQPS